MPSSFRLFLQRWFITTLAVLITANVVRGIHYDSVFGLVMASLFLGVLNAVLRPMLVIFSLPLLIMTFGFFWLMINAFLLYLVGWLVRPFHVESFGAAFWGALAISIISFLLNWMTGANRWPTPGDSHRQQKPPAPPNTGSGPIIDV